MSEQKLSEIYKRTWTPFFEAILRGDKNGEVRLNDFDVQSGDTLVLDEWNQNTGYTGRSIRRKVRAVFPVDFHQFHSAEEIQKYGHLYIELENPKVEALEAEVKALREKAEKWDILEKTSKGILTDNYYKMKIRAEAAESCIVEAGKHLEKLAPITDKVMNTEPYGALLEWEGGMKSALRGVGGI